MDLAPHAPDFGLAMNLSSLNVGIAVGAAVGSVLLDRGGLEILGYVGGALMVVAVILVAGEQSPA